jgi:phage gp29-like protein
MADDALAQALSFSPAGSKDKLVKGYARAQQPTLDIPVQAFSVWDSVQLVQGALTDLENGTFLNAAILCDATGRDDRISATLAARVNGVLSLPLEFEAGIDGSAKADAVAKEAEAQWPSMFPESELSKLIRWGRFVGIAPGEIVWNTRDTAAGKRWIPKLEVWHPQFLTWRWDWRDYALITQSDGVQRMGDSPGRWFTYCPNGRYLAWQTGLIRALAIPFLIRWWAYRDWARYSEKHGMPIFKAVVPKKADEIVKERYFNSMAALGAENTIKCEQDETTGRGYDAQLLEPTANTWAGFQGLINQCDSSIAILMLGQNLTTEVKGGSRSAAEVHERVRADFLRADAVTLSSFLRESVLKPWAAFNFGAG